MPEGLGEGRDELGDVVRDDGGHGRRARCLVVYMCACVAVRCTCVLAGGIGWNGKPRA